jgi:hypothetical protein
MIVMITVMMVMRMVIDPSTICSTCVVIISIRMRSKMINVDVVLVMLR